MISNTPYLFKIIYFLGFPYGSAGKESAFNAGDLDLISGLGRSPGEGKGYPLQCSGLENSMDCIVLGVAKIGHNWATFHFHPTCRESTFLLGEGWKLAEKQAVCRTGCHVSERGSLPRCYPLSPDPRSFSVRFSTEHITLASQQPSFPTWEIFPQP